MKARGNKNCRQTFTNLFITDMKYTSNQKSQLRSDRSNLEDQLQKGNVHLKNQKSVWVEPQEKTAFAV